MKRKIIQIVDRFISKDEEATLVVLADDGTVWEGCMTNTNAAAVTAAIRQRNIDKTTTIPARIYAFVWTQIPGLPDDNSNLGKVR
jgi:hypothetical protein